MRRTLSVGFFRVLLKDTGWEGGKNCLHSAVVFIVVVVDTAFLHFSCLCYILDAIYEGKSSQTLSVSKNALKCIR